MSESTRQEAAWLKEARELLLARKKQLEEQLKDLAQDKPAEDLGQDLGDQAFSSSMEALKGSLQDAEYREYRMILSALEAMQQGTYGICVDCDQRISEKRLRSQPNALRCITCQEALEERM